MNQKVKIAFCTEPIVITPNQSTEKNSIENRKYFSVILWIPIISISIFHSYILWMSNDLNTSIIKKILIIWSRIVSSNIIIIFIRVTADHYNPD